MEKDLNLKEVGLDLIKNQKKVVATVTIVDDGETTSAVIAGDSGRLVNLLANAMVNKPEFRELVGKAYLVSTLHSKL